jgi:small ligand-binding sensory domain FIST
MQVPTRPAVAGSGIGAATEWRAALDQALDRALEPLAGEAPDLLLLFASSAFTTHYDQMLSVAAERSGARDLAGCGASGVIAGDRELEGQPAIAALALRAAGSLLAVHRVLPEDLADGGPAPGAWPTRLGLLPQACTGLIVLADPFSTDIAALIAGLERDYPGVPLVGGLASGDPSVQRTHVFFGTQASGQGAVVVGLSGSVAIKPIVSQGCEPIGKPWTITEAEGHIVRTIGNRPAYEVVVETVEALSPPERQRVARNLLVGLAMDEYRDAFNRGDFLIRNLLGVDPRSGAIAVGAETRVGQTIQFQVRDARAADEELRHMLSASAAVAPRTAAALLFACNGRGAGLFGAPDHDARTTRELLGPIPLAGLFCNGEIGPVGQTTYLHGFTASLALITLNES